MAKPPLAPDPVPDKPASVPAADPLPPEGYVAALDRLGELVSRETVERLDAYLQLLRQWQRTINLVAASTLIDPWRRHLLDCAQLLPLVPETDGLVDLGSGAGLPGLVLATHRPSLRVSLVESDQRKGAFLLEARRRLALANLEVIGGRIEAVTPQPRHIVTARALAPLDQLLAWAEPWMKSPAICLFHKGYRYRDELTAADRRWMIDCSVVPSVTDPQGVVLRIANVKRK